MPKIVIPKSYQKFTEGQQEFFSPSLQLKTVLKELTIQYPLLLNLLFNEEFEPKSFLSIFINDKQLDVEEISLTELDSNTTITLVQAVAGG